MQEASASDKNGRGEGNSPPQLPQPPRLFPQSVNTILDKPIPISFPAEQFEKFEHSFNDTDNPAFPLSNNCVMNNLIASTVDSQETNIISRSRLNPPVLINSSVLNFGESMDIDKISESLRAMPLFSALSGGQ